MKYILTACAILFPLVAAAQDNDGFDRLMTRKRISCADIEENARFLIPAYHRNGHLDSLRYLLRYWERNCGQEEAITRTTLILDAEAGVLASYPFSRLTVWNMRDFKRKTQFAREHPERREFISGNLFWRDLDKVNDQFDLFTSVLAQEVRGKSNEPFAGQLLTFYGGETDSFFTLLHRRQIENRALQASYDSIITEIEDEYTVFMSVTAGWWIPTGNASLLGSHPELGFNMGVMRHGYSADLMILFRFLDAHSSYTVRKNGVPTMTDHFFSGYIGAQFGYDLIRRRTYDLSVLSGIAYDGFDAIAASNANANDNVSVNSLNLNLGVGGRYYLEEFRSTFLTAELRYHFVDYRNPGGTDLSGNSWSFRVGYNFSSGWQYELLRDLGAY
ncbi:MAG: hypothetical protein HUU02_06400 [Bacteroidetes bacterium]|nr:hypothetical protein [Bacteroidota bacterium]